MKKLKAIHPKDKLFDDFVTRVRKNMETVSVNYNKVEDGLPKRQIEKENWS